MCVSVCQCVSVCVCYVTGKAGVFCFLEIIFLFSKRYFNAGA